jgi:hypothetical protein
MESHRRRVEAERRFAKKQHRLQQEILRESFWNFAKHHNGSRDDTAGGTKPSSVSIRDATTVLSEVYRDSMVPFATDPEECWQRGVTIPPSLQRPMVVPSPDRRSVHTIPSYHSLAESLREQYWAARGGADRGVPIVLATTPERAQRRGREGSVEYRGTPFATYAHNFPYHVPPSPEYE